MTDTAIAAGLFTVEIQAGNDTTGIWQALAPAETVDTTEFFGTGWTAADVAEYAAENQNMAEGDGWRVCVWIGAADDVDTATDPAHIWTPPAAPSPFGMVTAFSAGQPIRPADRDEHTRSRRIGGIGLFHDHDGRLVYVAGGPETAVDAWSVLRITDPTDAALLGYGALPAGLVVICGGKHIADVSTLDEARQVIADRLGADIPVELIERPGRITTADRWVVA